MALPWPVEVYVHQLVERLHSICGTNLTGVYLHGSAALGGWTAAKSDVDVLAVVSRSPGAGAKALVAATLTEDAPAAPGAGLEFSLVTASSLKRVGVRPPFELHVATGPDAKVVDGDGHPGDADLVLHYAVCRERGVALFGPPAEEVFPEVSGEMVLSGLGAELAWAGREAPVRYQVLNAFRAWAYAEDGVLLSKLEAVDWARERGRFASLAEAAWAAQAGGAEPEDADDVPRLLQAAMEALNEASGGAAD